MIKLIATDLDGTLLDENKQVPPGFNEMVEALYRRGVRVAIASGRQYYNLLKLFYDIRDKLFFICENGAIVFDGEQNIFSDEIAPERLAKPLTAIKNIPTASAILCGVKSAYLYQGAAECEEHAKNYYERRTVAESILTAAQGDKICKIALFDAVCSEQNLWPLRQSFGTGFQMAISGKNWLDLMNSGIHKGVAMRKLQERLQITKMETMAFGDFLNDVEMMRESHFSYAMANAHAELAAVCNFSAPANTENGVMQVIKDTFNLS